MASQGAASSSANIVWDKSRLHSDRGAHSGKALAPSSSGTPARRSTNSAPASRSSHKSPESDLTMSFDPMKDLHMWTMWRVAVNGRIVDETRKRNRALQSKELGDFEFNPFGRALVKTPLDRFIRVENGSQNIAGLMMDPHGNAKYRLATRQFVFFGVPRVVLKKQSKHTSKLSQ